MLSSSAGAGSGLSPVLRQVGSSVVTYSQCQSPKRGRLRLIFRRQSHLRRAVDG